MNTPIIEGVAIIRLTEGREWIDMETFTTCGVRICQANADDIEQRCGLAWTKANPRHWIAEIIVKERETKP